MTKQFKKPWFSERYFGYGAGWPLTWQGWALLAVYGLVLFIAVKLLTELLLLAVIALATLVFAVIAAPRTQGGWRWRWGKWR